MTQVETRPAHFAGFREAERQAAELAAMRRMIEASHGCFSLTVVVCNSAALRDYLIGQLCDSFASIRVVAIPKGTVDVFGFVVEAMNNWVPAALFLANLEASLPSAQESQPTLRSLNASRELWERRYSCPVVLWLPEYAATLLCTQARDFWRYRSHGFEFVSEQAGIDAAFADQFCGDLSTAGGLPAEEKRFRIGELEQRIADAGEKPPEYLLWHMAVWLTELGFLYYYTGRLIEAEEMLRKALAINLTLGRHERIAVASGNLGVILLARADLDQAEVMVRKALAIFETLGRQEDMAAAYGNLGAIYKRRGDLDQAEAMHRKALEIHETSGREEGMAVDYFNLGVIYRKRGDLDQGEAMLRKALAIDENLGRQNGMARDYSDLGLIYRRRGDLEEAEAMLRKALAINENLGRQQGMASNYGNLGLIYLECGDLEQAEAMLRKSLPISEALGRPEDMARAFRNLALVCRGHGDLEGAEAMLRESLAIDENLGQQEDIASDCGNLGVIAGERGDFAGAREYWTRSRDLFARIGVRHRVEQVQGWLDALPE